MTDKENNIESKWILWNHKLDDNSWSNDSYNNMYEINNLFDYKILEDNITLQNLQNTMFFLMRDNIFPTWEDPLNKNGCGASFKVPSAKIYVIWNKLTSYLICENIQKDIKYWDNINGISISPKKEFNIIKIWFKNNVIDMKSINFIEPYITDKNGRIKKY